MKNEDIYNGATKRVKVKKGFIQHLIAYVGVLGLLYAIMYLENNGEMLPVIIVAMSWGIGLAAHYFSAFGTEHLGFLGFSSDWEEEELEKEIEKLTRIRELKEQVLHERTLLNDLDNLELKEQVSYERTHLNDLDNLELKEIEKKILHRDFD